MVRPPRFEVIPLDGIEDDVVDYVPAEATVTVAASPRQGVVATVDMANRLARRGVRAAPHLAARQIHDAAELAEILQALQIRSKVGVGDSLPMLRRHGRATRRLTGAWKPEHLLEDPAPAFADPPRQPCRSRRVHVQRTGGDGPMVASGEQPSAPSGS